MQSKADAKYNAEVKSKAGGSHREAVMGNATLTTKEARGKEKGGNGENLKSIRNDNLIAEEVKDTKSTKSSNARINLGSFLSG